MFWSEAAKISSADKQLTNIIGNVSGPEAISQLFHEKYKTLYNSVPTSDSDLSNIKNTLGERLHPSEVSNLDRVTPELICHCIGKLKPGKGDGSKGFRSDHHINAGNSLNVLLSLLFRVMVIHGHYPRNLLVSTIISIPKDLKSSLCNVDNYRSISLFNSIAKVFDYVIIELCNDQLIATDMQYAYKENHSTTLCSLMYLETLQYYRNSGSNVFSCLLDASKAFDRVHYGKLFNILLSKKLPICIIRMLLDCYVRQESRASWSSYYTDYFTMSNGVKQGGVLSAILFTLYLDKLLIRLKNSNIGCSINGCYTGALSYADDITLSCPSIRGLNRMLEICNSFAAEHNLIFNTKKSLGIKYGDPVCASETIYLGGKKIRWESSVCHLDNYFDTKLSDMIDYKIKCSRFIGSVNRVMANFGHLQSHILSQIFKTHCCTFYGSALWYFNSEGFAKMCTTWNKGVRTILELPIRAHTYLLGPLLNQQNIHEQLYVRSICCLYTMYHSSNYIVRTVFNNALYNSNSCIGYKMAYFRNTYAVDITKHDPSFVFSRVQATGTYNNIVHNATMDNLLTLLHVRSDISYIEGFDGSDIDDLIELVATL